MTARLYRFIQPIFEDEERLRLTGLLRAITIILAVPSAIYVLIALAVEGIRSGAILAAGILLLAFLVYGIVSRGHVRTAGFVLVIVLWLMMTIPVLGSPNQTMYAFSLTGYILPVLLAGVLFGGRAAIATAVLSFVSGLLFLLLQLGNGESLESLVLSLASESAISFIVAILITVANRSLQDALERARRGEHNLTERNRQLMEEIAIRGRVQSELHSREESSQQFQERLKALHEVNFTLSGLTDLDDIYRGAVELGREKLGFDRLGLFLLDERANMMIGTFGTDVNGETRDERPLKTPIKTDDPWVTESLSNKIRVSYRQDIPLRDNWEIVGQGWNAMAGLWNGEKVIGWLAADNLIHHQPLQDYQIELLSLYGSLLGHVIGQKQTQEALRISEDTAQQFQQRLKSLYEVTIELAKIPTLEEFYKAAVELGRSRLQFDRMGLFLHDEANQEMTGTFGTNQFGQTMDERHLRISIINLNWVKESISQANNQHIYIDYDQPLYYGEEYIGRGWRTVVALWSGEQVIGWMSVDNLLNQRLLLDYEIEILTLYGSMLGHLYIRKKSEQELQQSQEQLRLALKAARMRTWDWNIATDQIVGYGVGAWLPPFPTYQEFLQHVHTDDRERVWQSVQDAVAENKTYSAEYRFESPQTGWGWLYTIGQPYVDDEGKVIGLAGVSQDITERKQAEENLKGSEERFYKAFHANPSAISINAADDGHFIDVNESWLKLFGFTREECIGKTSVALNLWVDPEDDRKYVAKLETEGALYGEEVIRRTRSGSILHVLLYAEKIEIAGEPFYLIMMQDMTARIAAEKQSLELALEKERVDLLREFVGNISHDLKTPLTVINNSLYLLERLTDPTKQNEKLDLIKMQTQVLDRYIQDILTISRLDYTPQISHTRVYIDAALRNIEQRLRPSFEKNSLSMEMNLDGVLPPIWGDANELDRALVNLVENALNYTPAGGTILVHARANDSGVIVEVTDTGIGMNEADIPHIFERFYRSDQARTALKSGTGLGLAIVKRIVDMHQGTIQVESRLGKGSTFRLWLPAVQEKMN